MNVFTKSLAAATLGSALTLPYLASSGGWGLPNEQNAQIIGDMSKDCPPHLRQADGRCRQSLRSYGRRSALGGGPRSGK